MTTAETDRALALPPPTAEQLAERAARRDRLAALVTAASKTLREVTTEAVYDVVPPIPLPDSPRDRLITRITVRVTRLPGPTGRPGQTEVLAEHRARTADGRPRRNGAEWRALSESVAAELIVRALTQS
jgi:hypothetical protein